MDQLRHPAILTVLAFATASTTIARTHAFASGDEQSVDIVFNKSVRVIVDTRNSKMSPLQSSDNSSRKGVLTAS